MSEWTVLFKSFQVSTTVHVVLADKGTQQKLGQVRNQKELEPHGMPESLTSVVPGHLHHPCLHHRKRKAQDRSTQLQRLEHRRRSRKVIVYISALITYAACNYSTRIYVLSWPLAIIDPVAASGCAWSSSSALTGTSDSQRGTAARGRYARTARVRMRSMDLSGDGAAGGSSFSLLWCSLGGWRSSVWEVAKHGNFLD